MWNPITASCTVSGLVSFVVGSLSWSTRFEDMKSERDPLSRRATTSEPLISTVTTIHRGDLRTKSLTVMALRSSGSEGDSAVFRRDGVAPNSESAMDVIRSSPSPRLRWTFENTPSGIKTGRGGFGCAGSTGLLLSSSEESSCKSKGFVLVAGLRRVRWCSRTQTRLVSCEHQVTPHAPFLVEYTRPDQIAGTPIAVG